MGNMIDFPAWVGPPTRCRYRSRSRLTRTPHGTIRVTEQHLAR